MHKKRLKILFRLLILIGAFVLAACSNNSTLTRQPENSQGITLKASPSATNNFKSTQPIKVTPIISTQVVENNWWFHESVFEEIIFELKQINQFIQISNPQKAIFLIEPDFERGNAQGIVYQKLFVLTSPYTQLETGITKAELEKIIVDDELETELKIWINPLNFKYLAVMYKDLNPDNFILSNIYPKECDIQLCWRINSFEETEPFWKILQIDGNNPLHSDFNINNYPLVYQLKISYNPDGSVSLPEMKFNRKINFEQNLVTSVILTGTTALVRNSALKIEENGLSFPTLIIGEILADADLTHISNEVPFYTDCPPAIPLRKEMRFCSDPKYLEILKNSGADVIELTGNHLLDWGPSAFLETVQLYKTNGFSYYGGGFDLMDAEKPLEKIIKENKFVFLGCNQSGPDNNWATETRPGALKCDWTHLENEVRNYKEDGYLPIVTIQHYEVEDFTPLKQLKDDFSSLAKAGAVIISGSQAHFPQGIDFVGDSFIHYGLGNLFFDQMDNWLRKSMIDIHYFYNGQYLNTELIPIINENFGQPRLMSEVESRVFFEKLFDYSFYFHKENQ